MIDVITALNDERSIVRTWLMRGTLHLVASEDLGWMLSLLGPVFVRGNQARHAQLGLDPATKSKGVQAIRRILSNEGPLTRYEIVERLARHGVNLDPKTQAPIHLIQIAALNGVLCLGADRRNGEHTYALLEDWIGPQPAIPGEAALGELARRYFAAFGPAALDDFVAWSGLPVAQARAALHAVQPALEEVTIRGRANFLPKGRLLTWRQPASTGPSVRLLPAFDTYLFGYRSRDLAVPADLQKRLQRGGGWLHPAVVRDGRVIAAWTLRTLGRRRQIVIEEAQRLVPRIRAAVETERADIVRFLDGSISTVAGKPAAPPAPGRSARQ